MKKTLLLLVSVVALLSACNDDVVVSERDTNNQPQPIRWYLSKQETTDALRSVVDYSKLWNYKESIRIKFLNSQNNQKIIEKIKSIASEWEEYADINLTYVKSNENASIRISLGWQGSDSISWSYVGTDAKYVTIQTEATALLGGLQYLNDEQFRDNVLRLFGCILGYEYK